MEIKEAQKKTPLTRDEAEARKACLSNPTSGEHSVHYDLILTLRHSSHKNLGNVDRSFEGVLTTSFIYHSTEWSTGNNLFLNLWGEVAVLKINGEVCEIVYKDKRVYLPHEKLRNGELNVVTVTYFGFYTNRGCGLHHYIDPSDKKEYLYTQFEPFDCHLLFPCFDQPDLKATLNLSVYAPDEWVVLGNEKLNQQIKGIVEDEATAFFKLDSNDKEFLLASIKGLDYTYTSFNVTPRIATYLFAVCAGNYAVVKNPYDYVIPMKIYIRDSMKNFGEQEEFFKVTMAGMEFYREYFGYAFPYTKYDQIYCPEYNWGAMENVGLVTYNEFYLWKETPSQQKRARFGITILHELAHQWFGNLVTMKWWDDLWLNESFATFISFLCQEKATGLENYTNSWLSFNMSKGMAYREDQTTGTHPVYTNVLNTEDAETHFDMIVYYKGSSILKQLYYFIGYENFSAGLKDYFNTYAWKNTVFDQFISKMTDAVKKNAPDSPHDLQALCDSWLKKSGLTQIEVDYSVDTNNILTRLDIIQTAVLENHNNLQTHKCNILFVYGNGNNKVLSGQIINPEKNTSVTDSEFIGREAPKAIIVNEGDHAYFKWVVDVSSLNFLRTNLHKVGLDDLSRQLYYRSLFDMVRDSRMSTIEYLDIVNGLLLEENSPELVTASLRYISGVIKNYMPVDYFPQYSSLIFDLVKRKLYNSESDKDLQLTLIDLLLSFAHSDEHYNGYLRQWLDKGPFVDDKVFEPKLLTQDNRFSIIKGIFKSRSVSKEEKDRLLEEEIVRDKNSSSSLTARHSCYASLPDPEVKKELWEKYVNNSNKESLANMRASMGHFVSHHQYDLVKEYMVDKFFENVVQVGKNHEHFYVEFFVGSFAPYCFVSEEILKKLDELINSTTDIKLLNKVLVECKDDMVRFYSAHKLCEKYVGSRK